MPLRLLAPTTATLLLILTTLVVAAHAQTIPTQSVTERLPWFDSKGFTLNYTFYGSYYVGLQLENYSGRATIRVAGLAPNGSIELYTNTTTQAPQLPPPGATYDDPFFPAYLPVLPEYMVEPQSFSVLAPGYALFFNYVGNMTYNLQGKPTQTYVYSIAQTIYGQQGTPPIKKYLWVDAQNGLVVNLTLANPTTKAVSIALLTSYSQPNTATQNTTIQVEVPPYAAPGNYVSYQSTSSQNTIVTYRAMYAEPNGQFMFERSVAQAGVNQGAAFYVDNYTSPTFYPATYNLGQTLHFTVSQGQPYTATLKLLGTATVNTPAGNIKALAYANTSVGFEAYIDPKTGVAVILELPGGFLELASSNFIKTSTLSIPPAAYIALGVVATVVATTAYGIHKNNTNRKPLKRKGSRANTQKAKTQR